MKNITIAEINDLIQDGIKLSSTHNRLCLPVINRIYKKMRAGIKFADIKVSGNMICDGHHRYIASLLVHMPIDCCPTQTTSATEIYNWESVHFDEEDWDTEAKIKMLNEQDADFNELSIEMIEEIIK